MARQNVSVTDDAAKIGLDVETASRAMSSRTPRMRMPLGRWLTRARKLRPADVAAYGLIVLVGTLFAVACFSIWSWVGALLALALIVTLALAAPFMPAEATMRLYRAEPMDLRHGLPFYRMADVISHRAGLPVVPKLYVIPSLTVNAFAAGRPGHAAIALSEGLLRRLSLAEAGAVIAHEISHIRNDDLATLSRADLTARLMQAMWLAGLVLLALSLPDYLAGQSRMPWLAIMVLFATPALANLLQLALSRQREFDADLDAVRLTGSPQTVAAALAKMERHRGGLIEDFLLPTRRIPVPSLLRTHPSTQARLDRLEHVEAMPQYAPLAIEEIPMVSMVGRGPASLRARYRLTGLWF